MTDPERDVVVYAGRFVDRLPEVDRDTALSAWDTLPAVLLPRLERAAALVVCDPLSFPFEECDRLDVPLAVGLPADLGVEVLQSAVLPVLVPLLVPTDVVAVSDDRLWDRLQMASGLPASRRIADGDTNLAALLTAGRSLDRDRERKARDRAARDLLRGQVSAAALQQPVGVGLRLLLIAHDLPLWTHAAWPAARTITGVAADRETIIQARTDYPDAGFGRFGHAGLLPYRTQSYDQVVIADMLWRLTPARRRILLTEAWRVTRPGGQLTVVEDVVSTRTHGPTLTASAVLDVIRRAAHSAVTLGDVVSLRFPGEPVARLAAITLHRLGRTVGE